jgi:hypothetical protein
MRHQVSEVVNDGDYIVLYSAGLGGEYLTALITQCVSNINELDLIPADGPNQWSVVSKVTYSDVVISTNEIDGGGKYFSEDTHIKKDIYKDHLVDNVFNVWPSNMTAIILTANNNYEHWANVTWNKLKLDSHFKSDRTDYNGFIKNHVHTLTQDHNKRQDFADYFDKSYMFNMNTIKKVGKCFTGFNQRHFNKQYRVWKKENNNERN